MSLKDENNPKTFAKLYKQIARNDGLYKESHYEECRDVWHLLPKLAAEKELNSFANSASMANIRLKSAKDVGCKVDSIELSQSKTPSDAEIGQINEEICSAMLHYYDCQQPRLIRPFIGLVTSTLRGSINLAFSLCLDVCSRTELYLDLSITGNQKSLFVFRALLKRYSPVTFSVLIKMGALQDKYLNHMFVDLFTSILPHNDVLRILDNFLLEGRVVLYRYALAFFNFYKQAIKSKQWETGDLFWAHVFQKKTNIAECKAFYTDIHAYAFEVKHVRSIVERMFFINRDMGVSKYALDRLRTAFGKKNNASENEAFSDDLFVLFDPAPTEGSTVHDGVSYSQLSTGMYAHDLDALQDASGGNRGDCDSAVMYNDVNFGRASRIVQDVNMNHQLQAMCSASDRLDGFEMVFSSLDHGCLLSTLYENVHNWYPCIILVKTLPVKPSNIPSSVIGCYLNTSLTPPSTSVKGDGYTFIFRLGSDAENSRCHRWVDLKTPNAADSIKTATRSQFATCAREMISVGGSESHGTNGLRLDSDLRVVSSGPTDTFGNDSSLLSSQGSSVDSSAPVLIELVEVWTSRSKSIRGGFKPAN